MAWTLFGFEINRKKNQPAQLTSVDEPNKSFVAPQTDDGAVVIQSGSYYGTYVDLDGVVRNEIELITRYRELSLQPEVEEAIADIINEAICLEDNGQSVEVNIDDVKSSANIKKAIQQEFDFILKLLNFGQLGPEIFRRWYVDGRLFYHVIIDEENPKKGIQELRLIDPRRIRKIREIQKMKDPRTGMELIKSIQEYYLFNDRGIIGANNNTGQKIAIDSVINVNSGLLDAKNAMVLSYLHKAIKPYNQLRMVEDALVIYRLSRAPERRVFYIDVGDMPTIKAEQYLKDVMTKYRNKLVYDSNTGEIRDDRKHTAILEDIWIPRKNGQTASQIDTLPGGENLGKMEDVEYFKEKLYKSLSVPISRLQQGEGFMLGRVAEITRDELKFSKFIQRLRTKFSTMFDDLLRIQLVLKNICTAEEWDDFKEDVWYDFLKDNNFEELKQAELLRDKLSVLQLVDPYIGRFFSNEYIFKNVLHFTDEEIEEVQNQISQEGEALGPQVDQQGNPLPPGVPGMQPPLQPVPPPERPPIAPEEYARASERFASGPEDFNINE